jgi:hypothetical protein
MTVLKKGCPMSCQFVPPYLLRHVAEGAQEPLASTAEATLAVDEQLRASRNAAPKEVTPTAVANGVTRRVHDADNTEVLPGRLVRADGDPVSGDIAVDEAFDSSGQVLDLFASQFDRQSADGNGSPLSITVHYGRNYENAFWNGTQLVFGDGDGQVFDRFTKPMDVMAHEFTHAVTQFTAGLTYEGQSGALNESVSDAFASMARQRALGQSAGEADWLIGVGIFLPGINARALRSMSEPGTAYDDPQIGKDPQVGSMADYVNTTDDNGGVHINSGIPNRAFSLLAVDLGGESWSVAGKIWYDALVSGELTPRADFAAFARATLSSAGRLFGNDQSVAAKVESAWASVGVLGDQVAVVDPPDAPDGGSPIGAPASIVAVRRSGGYAGVTRTGELDLDSDPAGEEVRQLLMLVEPGQLSVSSPAPDRFVYTVECGAWHLTVPEQDLTPELYRVVQIVLTRGG